MAGSSWQEWVDQPVDPDAERDLSYELLEWEVVRAQSTEGEQYVFLPEEEAELKRDAFIVADSGSVCDLSDHQ